MDDPDQTEPVSSDPLDKTDDDLTVADEDRTLADDSVSGGLLTTPMPEVDIDRAELTITQFLEQKGLKGGVELDDTDSSVADSLRDRQGRKYDMGEVIAQGGMGAVIDAKDHCVRRHVAMKVMHQSKQTPSRVVRFIEEAQVTGQLEHPSIVPVHELGVDTSGNVFYTMKYVQGRTLKDVLEGIRDGDEEVIREYPLVRLLNVFLRVCDAMAFAHSHQVIHRDLKPENIMLGEYGEVLVVDWGLAKVLHHDGPEVEPEDFGVAGEDPPEWEVESDRLGEFAAGAQTMDGQVMGTPAFMPPEQAAGRLSEVGECSDVYSLGGVLYNILTLHQPVRGTDLPDMLEKVVSGDITHPTLFGKKGSGKKDEDLAVELRHCGGKKVPESLAAVAMKALSAKAEERYQSVTHLQKDVQAYLDGFATLAENASLVRQCILLFNRNKKQATVLTAAALMVVGITVGFIHQLTQKKAEAQVARDQAVVAAREAEEATALANDRADELNKELYANEMHLAQAAIHQQGGFLRLKNLLDNWRPKDGHPDLRGWEWYYLRSKLEQSELVLEHSSRVQGGSWSSDGRFVYTACNDHKIRVWNAGTGRIETTFEDHGSVTLSVVPSPGNDRLASLDVDGVVHIRDLQSGELLLEHKLSGGQDAVELTWSPDGTRLAVSDGPNALVVMDAKSGEVVMRFDEPSMIRSADWHVDGKRLAIGSGHTLLIPDLATREIKRFENRFMNQHIMDADWDADGTVLVSGNVGLFVLNPATGEVTKSIQILTGHRVDADVSDSSRLLALPSGDRGIYVIDPGKDREMTVLRGHTESVHAAAWSPDRRRVLSLGDDGARIWRVRTSDPEQVFSTHIISLDWRPGGDELAVGHYQRIDRLAPPDFEPVGGYALTGPLYTSDWSKDGERIAVASATQLGVWERNGEQPLWRVDVKRKNPNFPGGVQWEPGGDRIMYGNEAYHYALYSAEDGALLRRWDAPLHGRVFAWHPEGKRLAMLGNMRMKVLDLDSGEDVEDWPVEKWVTALAWRPGGDILATGRGSDYLVELWAMPGAKKVGEFIGGALNIMCMEWSPDGDLLAVGSLNNVVQIWDFELGKIVLTFQEDGPVGDLAWDESGTRLAVAVHRERGGVKILDAGRGYRSENSPRALPLQDHDLEADPDDAGLPDVIDRPDLIVRRPEGISEVEFQMFQRMDVNRDQQVTREEYVDLFAGTFTPSDLNADGMLSEAEFGNAAFKSMDTDQDGQATKAEFEAMYSIQFSGRDKDQSGFVTIDEM